MITIIVKSVYGFPGGDHCLYLPDGSSKEMLACRLPRNGRLIGDMPYTGFALFRWVPRMRGGKGGFGAQLRALGRRMRQAREDENQDDYRTLDGQRVRTLKEAQAYMTYLMEKKHDIDHDRAERIRKLSERLEQTSSKPAVKFDDHEYLDSCEQMIDEAKRAVALAMAASSSTTTPEQQVQKVQEEETQRLVLDVEDEIEELEREVYGSDEDGSPGSVPEEGLRDGSLKRKGENTNDDDDHTEPPVKKTRISFKKTAFSEFEDEDYGSEEDEDEDEVEVEDKDKDNVEAG